MMGNKSSKAKSYKINKRPKDDTSDNEDEATTSSPIQTEQGIKSDIRILMVVSSHSDMPLTDEEKKENKTAEKTGWYLPEVAHPYCLFKQKGYSMTFISPAGGLADCDPSSVTNYAKDKECQEFTKDCLNDKSQLKTSKISDIADANTYDAIFYAGGNGVMWDFKDCEAQNKVAAEIYEAGGIVSAVCHGPAGLINVKLSSGKYLIDGKTVTGFTNDEEMASGMIDKMPFLVESELKNKGAKYSSTKVWGSNVEISDRLITGQNPASASGVGKAVIQVLSEKTDAKKVVSPSSSVRILVVVSSYTNGFIDQLTEEEKKENKTADKTGWYLPEVAHPYCLWKEKGYSMTFISPSGGFADADPSSVTNYAKDKECQEFTKDCLNDKSQLKTQKISEVADANKYDAIFYAGGNGVMWDFKDCEAQSKVAAEIYEAGGIVSAVCHGPAGLINIKLSDGKYLIDGKTVTGFTNEEETISGLIDTMPFLVETELKNRGAKYSSTKAWGTNVEIDGRLVTGQNPASAAAVGKALIQVLEKKSTRILVVVSSYTNGFIDQLTDEEKKENKTADKTGWYLPEVAHPYCLWKEKGYSMTFISPAGGFAEADPSSVTNYAKDKECQEFTKDHLNDKSQLKTQKISEVADANTYDAIFYAGGNGVMWDFKDCEAQNKVAAEIYEAGGIVSAVCHGPAGLINIKLSDGKYLIDGKTVTGFTNEEETISGLIDTMPFLVESELKNRGAKYSSTKAWGTNVEIDGRLVTGQNPASAGAVGKAVIQVLSEKK